MKKLKYDEFKENLDKFGEKKATVLLFKSFLNDMDEIVKKRNVKTDSELVEIMRETNDKWNAIIKYDSNFKKDGFAKVLARKMKLDLNYLLNKEVDKK